jgi:hypothetical protein
MSFWREIQSSQNFCWLSRENFCRRTEKRKCNCPSQCGMTVDQLRNFYSRGWTWWRDDSSDEDDVEEDLTRERCCSSSSLVLVILSKDSLKITSLFFVDDSTSNISEQVNFNILQSFNDSYEIKFCLHLHYHLFIELILPSLLQRWMQHP